MPNPPPTQLDRQNAIRRILARAPAATQQILVDELNSLGFDATQSSISRDLRELGVIKTVAGYEIPAPVRGGEEEFAAVAHLVRDIKTAGPHLLVIKTSIGAAQQVALVLDRSGWSEIVGNIGGDDTVFTATSAASAQRNLLSRIERAMARA